LTFFIHNQKFLLALMFALPLSTLLPSASFRLLFSVCVCLLIFHIVFSHFFAVLLIFQGETSPNSLSCSTASSHSLAKHGERVTSMCLRLFLQCGIDNHSPALPVHSSCLSLYFSSFFMCASLFSFIILHSPC